MMLEHVGAPKAGALIFEAIEKVLSDKSAPLTPDIGGKATTSELGDAIVAAIG